MMTRAEVALITADYNERVARNEKRPPCNPYHYYICRRCGMAVNMLTTVHAERCGYADIEAMKVSRDIVEIGGRRRAGKDTCPEES